MINFKDFLLAYAAVLGWKEKDQDKIARRLCEEYFYSTKDVRREFGLICYGWIWGKTGDNATANVESIMGMNMMDEIYKIVAKENKW